MRKTARASRSRGRRPLSVRRPPAHGVQSGAQGVAEQPDIAEIGDELKPGGDPFTARLGRGDEAARRLLVPAAGGYHLAARGDEGRVGEAAGDAERDREVGMADETDIDA